MPKEIKTRKGNESMFDPFRDQIEKWCDDGLTPRQVFERLPDGYIFNSFYAYLITHRIREGAWKREYENRPVCDKCEYCHEFKNHLGKTTKSNRICTKSWQIINHLVVFCPTWCELYDKHDEGNEI